jgi:hypothetical protein
MSLVPEGLADKEDEEILVKMMVVNAGRESD